MKNLVIVAAAIALGGCSTLSPKNDSLNTKVEKSAVQSEAIQEKTITSSFVDEGVEVKYTLTGKLKEIVVTTQVPVSVASYKIVAETEARRRVTEFVHGTNVKSTKRVEVIGESLSDANDSTVESAEGVTTDTQRKAEAVEKTIVKEVREVTSEGRLTGWHVSGKPSSDGRVWITTLMWSEKSDDVAKLILSKQQ